MSDSWLKWVAIALVAIVLLASAYALRGNDDTNESEDDGESTDITDI